MKKIALAFLLTGLVCAVSVFGQTSNKTRPRIVRTPTPTPQTNRPELKNTPEDSTVQDRSAPVLVDNTSKKSPTTDPAVVPTVVDEGDDDEITIETNFVTLPVSVLDRNGRFVAGLLQKDFQIYENNVLQKVEYFASVEKPFTVVLMIDVSPSTQYKIDEIHQAAISFVNQLRPDDLVMVVAFDESYQVLTRPTNSRGQLEAAIRRANFGSGTSLYDSVSRTINQELRQIEGRKAIVLFTDGVDTTSRRANYESTLRQVEEVDALIYPIRYDTYNQYARGNGGGGTTRRIPRTGSILGDILGAIITGGGGNVRIGGGSGGAGTSAAEYERGKQYLGELARFSGGRKFEADTVSNLDSAFRSIAEELRRQYSLGYYPETGAKGERRRIRVRVMRPNLVVRTKTSYIVGSGG